MYTIQISKLRTKLSCFKLQHKINKIIYILNDMHIIINLKHVPTLGIKYYILWFIFQFLSGECSLNVYIDLFFQSTYQPILLTNHTYQIILIFLKIIFIHCKL